jgi:hypothetical protein
LFTQLFVVANSNNIYSDIKFTSINNKMSITGYDVKGDIYTALSNDPQFLFADIDSSISAVKIEFSKPLVNNMIIQSYFAKVGQNLSEQKSISYNAKQGQQQVILNIPYNNYSTLRVDVGSNSGQSFGLSDIKIRSTQISFLDKIKARINILETLILSIIFFAILYLVIRQKSKIFSEQRKTLDIIFISFCFIMFTLWAIVQPFNSCPDEYMRYDVIKYVFHYNRLPHGGNPLIRNEIWGFSYAFLPYLSGLVSVVFMKIVSIFTMNEQALILSARMAVVCFGTLTVYYVIKIANKCFEGGYKWLFIILVCCLPQFVFLTSYMNNDMLALLAVSMMIYYWIEGHENKWDIQSSIGLAIGVSICLLSYYNSYTFILFSIVFFIWSNIYNKVDKIIILKKFITVAIIVFILSGWWFIYNGIIYHGDFLGLKTMNQYSSIYATENMKLINRITPLKQGISLAFMLINMEWIKYTYLSFIGIFGYMNIQIYNWMYVFYSVIIFLGLITYFIKLVNLIKQKNIIYIFYLCMMMAGILTISFSIYYSYTSGFQAQGRYVMACLIPVMIFVTSGLEYMFSFMKQRFKINDKEIVIAVSVCCILISILCFTRIIIPTYRL